MIARKRNELFQKALSSLAVVLLLLLFCLITPAHAQPTSDQTATQRIMLVIDASGSMAQSDVEGGTRMDAAKSATIDVLKGLDNKVDAGLIVYGAHESNAEENREKGCQDVEVLAGAGKPDLAQLESQINALQPTGYTPIGISLRKAADELGNSGKRSIILVSDGEDTCAPPPVCEVAKGLAGAGIDLAIHTVGFKVDDTARSELECIAGVTGGTFTAADDTQALKDRLSTVVSRVGEGYEATGTPLELKDSPDDGLYVGEGQYLSNLPGPTETGKDAPAKYFKVNVPKGTQTIVSAATIVPLQLEGDTQSRYFNTNMKATNATCSETVDSGHEGGQYPDPPTAAVLTIEDEEGCDPAQWRVAVNRGGTVSPGELPVEILVGHEPIVKGEEAGPKDPDGSATQGGSAVEIVPTQPQPLVGANSYTEATPIQPGTYSDGIVAGETRIYKINVPWGQRVIASVEFDPKQSQKPRNGLVEIATPWRTVKSNYDFEPLDEAEVTKLDHQRTYPAYYLNRMGDDYPPRYKIDNAYAGDWYVMVTLDGIDDNGKASEQENYRLTVALDGQEVPGPSWRPPTTPGPQPTAELVSANSASEEQQPADAKTAENQNQSGASEKGLSNSGNAVEKLKDIISTPVAIIAIIAVIVGIIIGVLVKRNKRPRQ